MGTKLWACGSVSITSLMDRTAFSLIEFSRVLRTSSCSVRDRSVGWRVTRFHGDVRCNCLRLESYVTETLKRNGRVLSISSTNNRDADDDDDDDGTIEAVDDESGCGCDEEEGLCIAVGHLESESLFACCDFNCFKYTERKSMIIFFSRVGIDFLIDSFSFVGSLDGSATPSFPKDANIVSMLSMLFSSRLLLLLFVPFVGVGRAGDDDDDCDADISCRSSLF
mmetsp:Transcript_13980/g.15859  ORF Transcript_13980/g.15859 Transcript_13980/m.15859 type:complete len:223 (+) Transcript_13980:3331-3999(+)